MDRPAVYVVMGATGGIGSALCHRLRASGAEVALAARGSERLRELSSELGGAFFESLDATDISAVESFVAGVSDRTGSVDGIVNCVGSIVLRAAHQTTDEVWRTTIATNLDTAFAAVRAGAKNMRKNGGSIVLIASAAATVGLPNHEAIAAAKAGVIGLGRSAAATYAPKGIRVNIVAPGLVDTSLSAAITGNPMLLKASETMHPMGRIGQPDEIAGVIAWLLSKESSWVTGQVIGIDGGLSSIRSKASA